MNTKPALNKPTEAREAASDDLTIAYQVHTLVQMLTMRLAAPQHTMLPAPFPPFVH
ncbi:MAG TPA: hypothetical protein VFV19_16705 [Candidatus Polarisedimenticolaceae bacterium]|nr:hypothetical protein [Candidatus Polarisedimenticolaceae bacterium]